MFHRLIGKALKLANAQRSGAKFAEERAAVARAQVNRQMCLRSRNQRMLPGGKSLSMIRSSRSGSFLASLCEALKIIVARLEAV